MKAHEFVATWRKEKDDLLAEYIRPDSTLQVADRIRAMNLSESQKQQLISVIDGILVDTFYCSARGLGEKPSPLGEDFSMLAEWSTTGNRATQSTI